MKNTMNIEKLLIICFVILRKMRFCLTLKAEITKMLCCIYLNQIMNELSFDIIKLDGQLMSELKTVYKESDIIGLSKKIYDLWKLLSDKIKNEEPFYTFNYVSVR